MNQTHEPHNDSDALNKRLAEKFYSNSRYNPLFLGVAGAGFIAIYELTRFGIFGQAAPQLLYIGGITLLLAIVQIPILALARRGEGLAANFVGAASIGIFCILLTYLWQGVALFLIIVSLVMPVSAFRSGIHRRFIIGLLVIVLATVFGILYANYNSTFERLQNNSSAAISALAFLASAALLLVTITAIVQNNRYKSLQGLLLTSFALIVTIPTVMVAVLSAVGAFTNSQTQTYHTLEALTTLKKNQIQSLLNGFQNDMNRLQKDSEFAVNALNVLTPGDPSPAIKENSKNQARLRMKSDLSLEEQLYSEILVLNTQGDVVISTNSQREDSNFESQLFFRQGILRFYAGFSPELTSGKGNFIVAEPILDVNGAIIRGVLVFISNGNTIKSIMENTRGFEESETYLVDKNFIPVTATRTETSIVRTQAALEAILQAVTSGEALYDNYAGQQVLGYYEWFEPMQVAIIAEVPAGYASTSSLDSLAGSAVLALFVVAIAIAAVVISARSITEPIKSLAQTTESFAAGKLFVRATVDRKDEIGALANSYNQMAAELQASISQLEQHVEDRTRDLENQTLRLRVAAEIARDTASVRDLNQLLESSAELILTRFNFYHTGIYLLDNNKEYAVLVASPTKAGKQMIASGHKLSVGEEGIIGRVTLTGEPRIAFKTGIDSSHFNNAYLPNIQSEMALPLKVDSEVIGVLDIKSDQPQAFDPDDLAIMQLMADQLATAIERTRLLQTIERNLNELEGAYGSYTRESWKRLSEEGTTGNKGYRFDNIRIQPITELPEKGAEVLATGKTIFSNGTLKDSETQNVVAIPIKLRGQVIGLVSLRLHEGYEETTISTIEAAVERLAAAMESARLYEEARLRADREQSISRVTTTISAATEYEDILRTTIREVGSLLSDVEVSIQIHQGDNDHKKGS